MSDEVEYDLDTLLNELPTGMAYDKDSSNAKLLSLFADDLVAMQQLLTKIDDWRDIDNAQGVALDMVGADWQVPRNGNDDDFYRFLIKTKRLQRMTDGTYDSLVRLVSESLGAKYSEINVKPIKDEPNAIEVTNIPADYINGDTRKEAIVLQQIRDSVIAGVRVVNIGFQQTINSNMYIALYAQTNRRLYARMDV